MSIEARFVHQLGEFYLDAEFNVPAHGITALFGPSGSGKTTLLRAMAGLQRIPGGRLVVDGETWQGKLRFRPPHRRPVGYVFQEASLFPHLDVRDNLAFGYLRIRPGQRRMSLDRVIELLGLEALLARDTATLSGGERQRVAIARALAVSPRLLLMDEPLAALDAARRREILPYLETLHRELDMPVVYVSHAAPEVAQLADHLLLIENGRILGQGPIGIMLTRLDLPLAHGPDAAAVLRAKVARHDDHWNLTVLTFGGHRLMLPRAGLEPGESVRVRVESRDVSIVLDEPTETSILNIWPATVEQVTEEDGAQVTVRLDVGGNTLLARITRRSAARLHLAAGRQVYAQIKSVALLR